VQIPEIIAQSTFNSLQVTGGQSVKAKAEALL